ncbi:hypothetical protein B0H12DRAFT_761977 [Mycena haematopus]|nr:hypothetical protein B0H12DRAFT_761977 [Mycena haematopus]
MLCSRLPQIVVFRFATSTVVLFGSSGSPWWTQHSAVFGGYSSQSFHGFDSRSSRQAAALTDLYRLNAGSAWIASMDLVVGAVG